MAYDFIRKWINEAGINDNQEDSLILNKTSIDRGMFRSMSLKKVVSSIQKNQSTAENELFMKPDPTKIEGKRYGSYEKLNDKGFAPPETEVVNGDIIIGKVTPLQNSSGSKQYSDSSEIYKAYVSATVDKVYPDIKNQDGHETIKILLRSERVPRIGDKFCCYTPEHDVLTNKGWVKFEDLTKRHKVACLKGEKIYYKKPKEVMSYDYDGDIYVLESNQVSLRVTMNHRMYVGDRNGKKFCIKEASEVLGKRLKFKKNADEGIGEITEDDEGYLKIDEKKGRHKFVIPALDIKKDKNNDRVIKNNTAKGYYNDLEVNLDSWLTFFGIWFAEGSMRSERQVQISAHKARVKEALTKVEKELNLDFAKYEDKKTDTENNTWVTTEKRIVAYITQFNVGAINKKLPDWVWSLGRDECRVLLHALCLGDGDFMKGTTTVRYYTSSIKLKDQLQRLCLHAGYSGNVVMRYEKGRTAVIKSGINKDRKITTNADSYVVTIVTKQNQPLINKNLTSTDKSKQHDKKAKYKGKVYCCDMGDTDDEGEELEDDQKGIIYVRHNIGKDSKSSVPLWSGNSRNAQKGTNGIFLQGVDMPFTKEGLRPDIIMNPNGIPSRMTLGQLIEPLVGKMGANDGYNVDGTPFEDYDLSKIEQRLQELGYDPKGYEEMYNGMTGEKIKAKIFFGPTYYQRLKHMVEDKIHGRSRGIRTSLTHQPSEGGPSAHYR